MYWEQVGNPRGRPVLFLHGGPGAGAGAVHRRFFDPDYLARGDLRPARRRPVAARSGELRDNTTPDLVADIEALRRHLGIERWLLFGGSWGSTLALAYAQALSRAGERAACCAASSSAGRPRSTGSCTACARSSPTRLAAFVGFLPRGGARRPAGRLSAAGSDRSGPCRASAGGARLESVYEGSCCTLLPSPETVARFAQDRTALGLARIEAHYFAHDLFLPPEGLLGGDGPHRATSRPRSCRAATTWSARPCTAFELAAAWPRARLTIVPDAGHSALEPGVRRALVGAVERFRRRG